MPPPALDPTPSDPSLRFDAVRYQAEGGYTLPGLLLAVAFSLVGGILAGALAGWLSQWFYLILVFPAAVGLIVGCCAALGAHWGKLRNPRLGWIVGIAGACLAMATAHYVEFRNFLVEADKAAPGALNLQFSWRAFCHFLDQSALAGVQIVGRPGQQAMNLGYYGSYIYWIVEVLLVAAVAGTVVAHTAAAPFCSACGTWKTTRPLGRLNVPRAFALQAITSGDLLRLAGQALGPGPGRLSLAAAVCPHCGTSAPVDVSFHEITVDAKGGQKQTEIAHVTYPGPALKVLEALFEAEPSATPSEAGPAATTGLAPKRATTSADRILLRPLKAKGRGETWGLELAEDAASLVNAEGEVVATIPREEAPGRLVFPSFWDSIRNLGILTDEGKVVWFKPDKPAIRAIKKNLRA